MKLLSKFSSSFDGAAGKLIGSHLLSLANIFFITLWLTLNLDLKVLALVLSVEGVAIWTVVLKSTHRIQDIQEKKDRFENKRFREFLEDDIQATRQNLKLTKEVFKKLQEIDFKLEILEGEIEKQKKALDFDLEQRTELNSPVQKPLA